MSKRKKCHQCQRPAGLCLCGLIPQLASQTQILLLQHPSEQKHPLNTARLAALGLTNALLWIGETFDQLNDYLAEQQAAYRPVLLYPSEQAATALSYLQQNVSATPETPFKPYLVVVPDGTWKKARKIIYCNPLLQSLPHITLTDAPVSQYRLRKASEEAALSTLEAVVYLLNELEQPASFNQLLVPFNQLIEQQIQAMGQQIYQRNYLDQQAK